MAQDTNTNLPTVEQYAARELRSRIEDVAVDIERLAASIRYRADDIDRVSDSRDSHNAYAHVVAAIHREIVTTWLNLGISGLISNAATADVARAKGE